MAEQLSLPIESHLQIHESDGSGNLPIGHPRELEVVQNFRTGKMNLNYSSNDVAWHPLHTYSKWIATAATNGAVVIWNTASLDPSGKSLAKQEVSLVRFILFLLLFAKCRLALLCRDVVPPEICSLCKIVVLCALVDIEES
jgi:hypothetical protein